MSAEPTSLLRFSRVALVFKSTRERAVAHASHVVFDFCRSWPDLALRMSVPPRYAPGRGRISTKFRSQPSVEPVEFPAPLVRCVREPLGLTASEIQGATSPRQQRPSQLRLLFGAPYPQLLR
jgi:hypothetical protein